MSFKQHIGLHLRLEDTLSNLVQEALSYQITSFQFFLIKQKTDKYLSINTQERDDFIKLRRSHFSNLYIHSSYWINPATSNKNIFDLSKMLLKKELTLAQSLEIGYLVLHAGSAKGYPTTGNDPQGKQEGIKTLAKMLNSILKKDYGVQILLENSAHGKRTIGNDLQDFVQLKNELDYPEKIGYCIDTAHAFSYGYDLEPIDTFVHLIDKTLGLKNVKLIHFNDTADTHGSMQDKHAFPGHGNIGKTTLQQLLHHPHLIAIPKIIESPPGDKQIITDALEDVCTW